VKNSELRLGNQSRKVFFDWAGLIRFLLETPGERQKIGSAWPLFLDIVRKVDNSGICFDTYSKMAKRYGVAVITVKKWRKHLHEHSVVESFSQGRTMAFRLLEPYRASLRSDEDLEGNDEMNALRALKGILTRCLKET